MLVYQVLVSMNFDLSLQDLDMVWRFGCLHDPASDTVWQRCFVDYLIGSFAHSLKFPALTAGHTHVTREIFREDACQAKSCHIRGTALYLFAIVRLDPLYSCLTTDIDGHAIRRPGYRQMACHSTLTPGWDSDLEYPESISLKLILC